MRTLPMNTYKGLLSGFGLLAFLVYATAAQAMMMTSGIARSISIGDLTLTGVYPRIFTPNGDGFNDKVGFHFDNPEDLPVTGTIYNLAGSQVANLQGGSDPSSLLLWDGKDSSGHTAPSGIYLYQITF